MHSSDFVHLGTLYLLVLFSVITWSIILIKGVQHFRLSRHNKRFTKAFWSAANLQTAVDLALAEQGTAARLSAAGLLVLRDETSDSGINLEHTGDRQDLLERALRQQIHKERRGLENGLALLASIGSISPFVGLFGTVWGIMHALVGISQAGSASLEVVAGPIGEALVATGVGIAVAIPAVLAYNFFVRRLKVINADLDELGADLISLARKSGYRIVQQNTTKVSGSNDHSVSPLVNASNKPSGRSFAAQPI